MKTWNTPEFLTLEISETAANHQNGNNHGKMCLYNASIPCNAQGNGNGICKNCIYNAPVEIPGEGSISIEDRLS